jgi:hypothetical protein
MSNFPPVGSVVCGCDEDSACTFHAEMIYQRGFQGVLDAMMKQAADLYKASPLDGMIEDAKTDPEMAQALDALYGPDFLAEREIKRLAKVDPREVYCDRGPDGDNCLDCPDCRM